MNTDASSLASIASALAPWVALLLSALSFRTSRKAFKLAEAQDERRKPLLFLYLRDGYFRRGQDGKSRLYAFLLSVSNRSDSANAIAELELRLTYTTQTNSVVTLRIRAEQERAEPMDQQIEPRLLIPTDLSAHQTVLGWCILRVASSIFENIRKLDRHIIAATDSHGIEATVEPILLKEYDSDVKHTVSTEIPIQQ
jgi:hypothetical protein